jgi:hypothetical protein
MALLDDDNDSMTASYLNSTPLHVSSIDSRTGLQNGKKKANGKKPSKKKAVDCPIFLQSEYLSF